WLTIILIILITLTGMSHFMKKEPKEATNQVQRQTNLHPKEQIPSKFPDIQLFLETKEVQGGRISIETPVTTSDAINKKVKQWTEEQKTSFLENIKEGNADKKQPSLHLTLKTEKV